MKKKIGFCIIITIFSIVQCLAQSNNNIIFPNTENTPDSIIFQNCIDSIDKYVYLDSRKIKPYVLLCEEMIRDQKELPNSHRLEFVIQCIYNEYNYNDYFGAFKLIETNRKLLDLEGILPSQKNQYKYLDGHTAMVLGEIGNAQRIFYELLEMAQENNNVPVILQSMSSLGKVFSEQNDFDNAEKYFLEYEKIIPDSSQLNKINNHISLVRLYLKNDKIDKAEYYNEMALKVSESLNALDFRLDILLLKIAISIEKGRVDIAKEAHKEASVIAEKMDNYSYQQLCKTNYAEILRAENKTGEALVIYESLITKEELGDSVLTKLLNYYQSAYEVAGEKGNFEKGFAYVKKANQLKDSLFVEEQKQKSQYLKIKFDVKQKEKENTLLTTQVLQKKYQNKLLYALVTIFFMITLFLFVAFFQKKRYNKKLEEEVSNRTRDFEDANKKLENLNEELNEFNKILSHDLKEPLRSIVGFSSMANRELELYKGKNDQVVEYLNYVIKSGKQLHQLIDDVSNFQSIGNMSSEDLKFVNMNNTIRSIIDSTHYFIHHKNAKVEFNNLPSIFSFDTLLFLVFKNLIENAIKFNENAKPVVHITYKMKGNFHCFLVKDNGIGIASEFHEKIFEMFKRLNNRSVYEGSGLGLNIVKKLLHRIGGDICIVESEENKGSTFEVSLPIIQQ